MLKTPIESVTIPKGPTSLDRPSLEDLRRESWEWRDIVPRNNIGAVIHLDAFRITTYPIQVFEYASWFNGLPTHDSRRYSDLEKHVKDLVDTLGCESTAPMVGLTYQDIFHYCTAHGGHIPSEAQWLRAATGGGEMPTFYGENDVQALNINWSSDLLDRALDQGLDELTLLRPVTASRNVSPFGVRDTLGNCDEITATRPLGYHRKYRVLMKVGLFASALCPLFRTAVLINGTYPSGNKVRVKHHGFRVCWPASS